MIDHPHLGAALAELDPHHHLGVVGSDRASAFSTSSSSTRRAAVRLSVAMTGWPGTSTRTRSSISAASVGDLGDVGPFGEPGLDGGLETLHEAGETFGASDERVERRVALLDGHPRALGATAPCRGSR